MAAKTPQERNRARKESRKRRARQNLITCVILFFIVVIVLIVLIAGIAKKKSNKQDVSKAESISSKVEESNGENLNKDANGNYIQPDGAAWNLILVNDWNAIDEEYVSGIPFDNYNETWQFDSRALPYLNQMLEAANADGCDIWGQSLYRDYDTQKVLYERQVDQFLAEGYTQEDAEVEAATIVKRPGTSEHNTGLAVDFECGEFEDLDEGFENTKAFVWLQEHCAEYGFVLRFPKDKETVTGVIYEPWHYRYVGKEAATEIMSRHICLEEYLAEKGL